MSGWIAAATLVLAFLSGGGGFWYGQRVQRTADEAQAARDEKLVTQATQSAELAAATAIAGIEVRHVTIKQQLEKELRTSVEYRDCVADQRVLDLTNAALTEPAPAGNSGVSDAHTPYRSEF